MGLNGKLVSQLSVKWDGDLFHLFQFPYQFSEITPHMVQRADLLAGTWGTAGSIILMTYTQDGVNSVAKDVIESVVMEGKKKSITFKMVEGDPLRVYNSFKIIVDVEEGDGVDKTVTWTLEYEKKKEAAPQPSAFMDFAMNFTKDVERSRLLVPN